MQLLTKPTVTNSVDEVSETSITQETSEISDVKKSEIVLTPKTEVIEVNNSDTQLVHGVKYNKKNAELLAKNIVDILPENRDEALCARYVKLAVKKSGLGEYIEGNGEYCKNIFRANPNFKEVKVKGNDLDKLPKGCIIVYDAFDKVTDKNNNHFKIGEDGHVLITLGDGRGCSDVVEDEIFKSDRAYVFIPV